MAKGQMKGNKEAKKAKADKNQKGAGSAYKQSQEKGGTSATQNLTRVAALRK